MDQNIKSESEHSTCVLLPVFSAMKQDIFLEILKKTVARTRLSEYNLGNAFLSGLSATTLSIEFEDLSDQYNGGELETEPQEIRVSKLLGFWAASSFPSLGKKLLGDHWRLQVERTITIGDQQTMTADLDAQIMKLMKLRAIELTVSHSTRAKIKHFVTVPRNVCKDDSVQISKKMKLLDIHESFMENCWHALKYGKYFSDVDSKKHDKIDGLLNERPEIQSDSGSDILLTVKRASTDIFDSVFGPQPVSTAKKPRVDFGFNTVNSESCIENLQPILEAMGNDITKLTYLVAGFKKVEDCQQIIFQLQNSLAESERKKQESVNENDALRKQLTASLGQSEQRNLESVDQNNKMLEQVNEMRNAAEELKKILSQSDQKNLDLIKENERMVHQLNEWKNYGERMQNFLSESDRKKLELVSEIDTLRLKLNDVTTKSEELKKNLSQSDQKNVDLVGENERMVHQLNEWNNYGERMQNFLSESDRKKLELVGEIDTLRLKLIGMTTNAEELKKNVRQSDQKNVQLVSENEHLWQRMNELRKDFDKMVMTLQSQIQNIGTADGSTSKSDKENIGKSSETFNEAKCSLRKSNPPRPKAVCTKGNKKR